MDRAALLAVVGSCVLLAGCLRRATFASCDTDSDCSANGVAGHCEADRACSVDDASCTASGHRYLPSAPNAGACTDPPDAALADTSVGIDGRPDAPSSSGLECVKGGKRSADTSCAQEICQIEPRCCSEQWDATCVRWAETTCDLACSTMAFVGGGPSAIVFRTDTWTPIWNDPQSNAASGGYWADYDNDGDVDLATVEYYGMRVYKNQGFDGTHLDLHSEWEKTWASLGGNTAFNGRTGAWVDFDGDGDLDLSFGGFEGVLLVENQAGVFTNERVLYRVPTPTETDAMPVASKTTGLAWGDVDGHDGPDLIVVAEDQARLYFNDGHGNLTLQPWTGRRDGYAVQFCNLDTDPAAEVVIAGNSFLSVFELAGGTIEDDSDSTKVSPNGGTWFTDVRCGDLDHDGDLDLFASAWGDKPRVFRNGNQTLTGLSSAWGGAGEPVPVGQQWGLDLGDLDGDHKLDAVATGDAFENVMKIQIYANTSTNMNQSIGFSVAAPLGSGYEIQSQDVELAPLPP